MPFSADIEEIIQGIRPKSKYSRSQIDALIEAEAERTGVPSAVLRAVVSKESNYNPYAVSHKGARGLMQLLPGTAEEMGLQPGESLFAPETNIRLGTAYLKQQYDTFGGNWDKALTAYNWGPENVKKGGRRPAETREYVETVTKRAGIPTFHGPSKDLAQKIIAGIQPKPKVPKIQPEIGALTPQFEPTTFETTAAPAVSTRVQKPIPSPAVTTPELRPATEVPTRELTPAEQTALGRAMEARERAREPGYELYGGGSRRMDILADFLLWPTLSAMLTPPGAGAVATGTGILKSLGGKGLLKALPAALGKGAAVGATRGALKEYVPQKGYKPTPETLKKVGKEALTGAAIYGVGLGAKGIAQKLTKIPAKSFILTKEKIRSLHGLEGERLGGTIPNYNKIARQVWKTGKPRKVIISSGIENKLADKPWWAAVKKKLGLTVVKPEIVTDRRRALPSQISVKSEIKPEIKPPAVEAKPVVKPVTPAVGKKVFEVSDYTPYQRMNMVKTGARIGRLKSLYNAKKQGYDFARIGDRTMKIDTAIRRVEKQTPVSERYEAKGISKKEKVISEPSKKLSAWELATEEAKAIARKLKPGEKIYVSPQFRIKVSEVFAKERLVNSSDYLKKAGLEQTEPLNYWQKSKVEKKPPLGLKKKAIPQVSEVTIGEATKKGLTPIRYQAFKDRAGGKLFLKDKENNKYWAFAYPDKAKEMLKARKLAKPQIGKRERLLQELEKGKVSITSPAYDEKTAQKLYEEGIITYGAAAIPGKGTYIRKLAKPAEKVDVNAQYYFPELKKVYTPKEFVAEGGNISKGPLGTTWGMRGKVQMHIKISDIPKEIEKLEKVSADVSKSTGKPYEHPVLKQYKKFQAEIEAISVKPAEKAKLETREPQEIEREIFSIKKRAQRRGWLAEDRKQLKLLEEELYEARSERMPPDSLEAMIKRYRKYWKKPTLNEAKMISRDTGKTAAQEHREFAETIVKQAKIEKKPIPPEVLRDYPEFAKRVKAKPKLSSPFRVTETGDKLAVSAKGELFRLDVEGKPTGEPIAKLVDGEWKSRISRWQKSPHLTPQSLYAVNKALKEANRGLAEKRLLKMMEGKRAEEKVTVGLEVLKKKKVSPLKGEKLTNVLSIFDKSMRVPLNKVEVIHPTKGHNAFWYKNTRLKLTKEQQDIVLAKPEALTIPKELEGLKVGDVVTFRDKEGKVRTAPIAKIATVKGEKVALMKDSIGRRFKMPVEKLTKTETRAGEVKTVKAGSIPKGKAVLLENGEVYWSRGRSGGLVKLEDGKTKLLRPDENLRIVGDIGDPRTLKAGGKVHPPIGEQKEMWPSKELPASKVQIIRAHTIARKVGLISKTKLGKLSSIRYRRLAQGMTGKRSMKAMTREEAEDFINAMESLTHRQPWEPPIIPLSTKIVPKEFFDIQFKEPGLAKVFTPKEYYQRILGTEPLLKPVVDARKAAYLEQQDLFKWVDRVVKRVNKQAKISLKDRAVAKILNRPTGQIMKMRDLLDVYADAPDFLAPEEAKVFTEVRDFTKNLLKRTNEMREKLGLEPIKEVKAYITHYLDELARQIIQKKYPFPEDVKYWLKRNMPSKVYNPTALQRKVKEDLQKLFSRDLGKVLKALIKYDLRDIYLSEPYSVLRAELNALGDKIPARTRSEIDKFLQHDIFNYPTELDQMLNKTLEKPTQAINYFLRPLNRVVVNPIMSLSNITRRLVMGATIWGRPKLALRNILTQKLLTMDLYPIRHYMKAQFWATPKEVMKNLRETPFYKLSRRFEDIPEGLRKVEWAGMAPYQKSHAGVNYLSNVDVAMKVGYYAAEDLVKQCQNPNSRFYKYLQKRATKDGVPLEKYLWKKEDILREAEEAGSLTQWLYFTTDMPWMYRGHALRAMATLQSWWQNFFFKHHREALSRMIRGKTSWGKPIPPSWRLNWIKGTAVILGILEGLRRATGLDYKRFLFLWGPLPAYLSPPGQILVGLMKYITARSDWQRDQAKRQIKYSYKAIVPGSLAWRDFSRWWRGEISLKELLFYTEKGKKKKTIKFPEGTKYIEPKYMEPGKYTEPKYREAVGGE